MIFDDLLRIIRIILFTIIFILTPDQYLSEYQEPIGRHEPIPTATPAPKPKPTSKPKAKPPRPPHSLTGTARWYATGRNGLFAAAGPKLRKALGGDWRGRHVLVCHRTRCEEVVLNDWCACGSGSIIDLSDEAFRFFAPLSRGVIKVTVGW